MSGFSGADIAGLARDFLLGGFASLFDDATPSPPPFFYPPALAAGRDDRFATLASFAVTAAAPRARALGPEATFADLLALQGEPPADLAAHARCSARFLFAAPGPETAVRGRRESARLGCAGRGECLGALVHDPAARALAFVFVGSGTRCHWLADFDYVQAPVLPALGADEVDGEGGLAHWGFLRSYLAVREEVRAAARAHAPRTVLFAGVSMGGAIATIAALDFAVAPPTEVQLNAAGKDLPRLVHRSVAAPAVFDPRGAALFDSAVGDSRRIVNEADVVPTLPLPLMPALVRGRREVFRYKQTKNAAAFYVNLGSYAKNHTAAYVIDAVVKL